MIKALLYNTVKTPLAGQFYNVELQSLYLARMDKPNHESRTFYQLIGPKTLARFIVLFALTLVLGSCGNKIISFNVTPRSIAPWDTVWITYKARGNAILLVRDGLPDTARKQFTRHYKLVIPQKQGDDISRPIDVTVFQGEATDQLAINKIQVKGDTLIAGVVNDTIRWSGPFLCRTIKNTSGRTLEVRHAGKTLAGLAPGETDALTFEDTAVSGPWELRTLKTTLEKADSTRLPHNLTLLITLKHQPYHYAH
jgi:hypothetical protein